LLKKEIGIFSPQAKLCFDRLPSDAAAAVKRRCEDHDLWQNNACTETTISDDREI